MPPFEEPLDDIAADIRSAIDAGSSAPEPVVADAPISEATPGAPVDPAAQQTPQENDGRARDESGRFAKKEGVANSTETAQPDAASPVATAEPPTETIPPPHSATAAVKAAWDTYPLEIRKELVRIEAEAQRGKTEWQSKGERLNRFDAIVSSRKERLALAGLDEFTALQSLFAAQDYLERDPQGAIAYLARQYGAQVPPSGRQDPAQGFQQAQPQADPQILNLAQQVQQLTQHIQQQQEVQSREELNRVQSDVESFRKGNLYFDNVKGEMGKLIEAGLATGLADAYEKACYANAEIRPLLIAANAPKPLAQALAQPGTPAGLSVTGSPGLSRPTVSSDPNSSIEDDVRSAFAQVSGRV